MTYAPSQRPRGARITRARVASYRVRLPAPARAGPRRVGERRGAILRVAAAGAVGVGEASPLPGYSPDAIGDVLRGLGRFADSLEGAALDLEDAPSRAEFLANRLPEALPSARFAAETALLDLAAQLAGVPVRALLARRAGGSPAAHSVPAAALVELGDEEAARRAIDAGFRCLKVKIGGSAPIERDADALARLRGVAGDAVELRADANGTLSPETAGDALAALQRAGPAFVEEPVPPDALASLPPGPLAIAIDESARRADLWRLLPKGRRLAAVVLKPALLGGIARSLALAGEARDRGAAPIVSHIFGGPVERAACAELALALAERTAAGLGPHAGLEPFAPARDGYGRGRAIGATAAPGLALEHREALP